MHADTMAGHSTSILSGVTWPLGSSWLKRNGSQSAHGEGPQPHTLGASWAWGRGATGTSLNHTLGEIDRTAAATHTTPLGILQALIHEDGHIGQHTRELPGRSTIILSMLHPVLHTLCFTHQSFVWALMHHTHRKVNGKMGRNGVVGLVMQEGPRGPVALSVCGPVAIPDQWADKKRLLGDRQVV